MKSIITIILLFIFQSTALSLFSQNYCSVEVDQFICEGDSAWLENSWQTQKGVYNDTLKNVGQCDSIVKTNLHLNEPVIVVIEDSILQGEYINFGDEELRDAGIYTRILKNVDGCDSIIELHLSVISTSKELIIGENIKGLNDKFYHYVVPARKVMKK